MTPNPPPDPHQELKHDLIRLYMHLEFGPYVARLDVEEVENHMMCLLNDILPSHAGGCRRELSAKMSPGQKDDQIAEFVSNIRKYLQERWRRGDLYAFDPGFLVAQFRGQLSAHIREGKKTKSGDSNLEEVQSPVKRDPDEQQRDEEVQELVQECYQNLLRQISGQDHLKAVLEEWIRSGGKQGWRTTITDELTYRVEFPKTHRFKLTAELLAPLQAAEVSEAVLSGLQGKTYTQEQLLAELTRILDQEKLTRIHKEISDKVKRKWLYRRVYFDHLPYLREQIWEAFTPSWEELGGSEDLLPEQVDEGIDMLIKYLNERRIGMSDSGETPSGASPSDSSGEGTRARREERFTWLRLERKQEMRQRAIPHPRLISLMNLYASAREESDIVREVYGEALQAAEQLKVDLNELAGWNTEITKDGRETIKAWTFYDGIQGNRGVRKVKGLLETHPDWATFEPLITAAQKKVFFLTLPTLLGLDLLDVRARLLAMRKRLSKNKS